MLAGVSTAEANTDTAKTQLEKTRPDLKEAANRTLQVKVSSALE
jgi:hypothetical protein